MPLPSRDTFWGQEPLGSPSPCHRSGNLGPARKGACPRDTEQGHCVSPHSLDTEVHVCCWRSCWPKPWVLSLSCRDDSWKQPLSPTPGASCSCAHSVHLKAAGTPSFPWPSPCTQHTECDRNRVLNQWGLQEVATDHQKAKFSRSFS